MGQLNQAMHAINDSTSQITRIIKFIQEIAFQTNLLALNAAVEAARAGEHGKGFAVVAEEVRNLAQRSAQAAQDSTELIEGAAARAKDGSTVADSAAQVLRTIIEDVAKVTELLGGITRASEEQAAGVEQVNTAVSEMDRVTQQNAAVAQQSASAAETAQRAIRSSQGNGGATERDHHRRQGGRRATSAARRYGGERRKAALLSSVGVVPGRRPERRMGRSR